MPHAGDQLAQVLLDFGVAHVFGAPGGQTLPLYDGVRRRSPGIQHVLVRDERSGAYAADAYARLTGGLGACDATMGPGATKLVDGLAEAYNASVPILALTSDLSTDISVQRRRGGANQAIDQLAILRPVVKGQWVLSRPEVMRAMALQAARTATSGRPGPAQLDLPEDVFRGAVEEVRGVEESERRWGRYPSDRTAPGAGDVEAAAGLLRNAERPVLIAGGGALLSGATAEVQRLAEQLSMPVAVTLQGKGAIADTHPLALGVIGFLGGTRPAQAAVEQADLVFLVGFKSSQNATFRWTLPRPGQTVVHLDVDPEEIGKVFPTAVGLVGDAREGLRALLAALEGHRVPDRHWLRLIEEEQERWRGQLEAEAGRDSTPLVPQRVARAVNDLAGPDDLLVCEASFASGWGALYWRRDRPGRSILYPRGMHGLGWSIPAALGAALARPGTPVWVLVGDGGLGYCVAELETLRRLDLPVRVVVLNNSTLAYLKWEQALFWEGNYQSVDFGRVDFAAVARGFGLGAWRAETPQELQAGLRELARHEGPALLDVTTAAWEASVAKFREGRAQVDPALMEERA